MRNLQWLLLSLPVLLPKNKGEHAVKKIKQRARFGNRPDCYSLKKSRGDRCHRDPPRQHLIRVPCAPIPIFNYALIQSSFYLADTYKYMADNSSLLRQLANRAREWHTNTGISQSMMAHAIGMEDGNYSAFLAGKKGLGAESTCLLLEFIAMPRREAIAKFSAPVRTSKVVSFQSKGTKMYFDNDGYVPGLSGTDPNGTDDITSVVGAASENGYTPSTTDVLRQCRALHRKAIRAINSILQKAIPNANGSTAPTSQRFSR
jgi:hypothetical protein